MSRTRPGLGRRPQRHPTVGYGHPPEAHRFTPGQSGNPRGRPKGTTSRRPTRPPDPLAKVAPLPTPPAAPAGRPGSDRFRG